MSQQTHERYVELVNLKLREADELFGTRLHGTVKVTFDGRGGICGKATVNRRGLVPQLSFIVNPEALEQDWNDMVDDTIPHEIAHLVNFTLPRTGKNHDRGWKRTCQALGGTGTRTAKQGNYNLTPARVSTNHRYMLASGTEHHLGPRRHAKLQKGTDKYSVSSTREPILASQYIGPVTPPKLNTIKHAKAKPLPVRGGKRTKTSIVRDLVMRWMTEGQTPESILTNPAHIDKVRVEAGYPHNSIAKSSLKHNVEKILAEQ